MLNSFKQRRVNDDVSGRVLFDSSSVVLICCQFVWSDQLVAVQFTHLHPCGMWAYHDTWLQDGCISLSHLITIYLNMKLKYDFWPTFLHYIKLIQNMIIWLRMSIYYFSNITRSLLDMTQTEVIKSDFITFIYSSVHSTLLDLSWFWCCFVLFCLFDFCFLFIDIVQFNLQLNSYVGTSLYPIFTLATKPS